MAPDDDTIHGRTLWPDTLETTSSLDVIFASR
jgi:hypothetical protein